MGELRFSIHPAIGIARIGNSDEYYIGPETPGYVPPDGAKFKDENGRIKRQAARFRIFVHDDDRVIEVVDGEDGIEISWRVHVANRKAAWYTVDEPLDLAPNLAKSASQRNSNFRGPRTQLVIDPGAALISGANQGPVPLDGHFVDRPVRLGELRTDECGRLIFLSGKGDSASLDGSLATDDANNDGWYDDIADGPVRAAIRYRGKEYNPDPAYVVVAPPNYGQGIHPIPSMFDVLENLFSNGEPPRPVVFYRDIYPILERLVRCQWVNEGIYMLIGAFSSSDWTDPALTAALSDPGQAARATRQRVYRWFRSPHGLKRQGSLLPPFYGDGDNFPNEAIYDLSLTPRQHESLRLWADGKFVPGGPQDPIEQTDALDRAALEDCLGGPFSPGVDLPWVLRNPRIWAAPFRLKVPAERAPVRDDFGTILQPKDCLRAGGPLDGTGPGMLTRWMGVPWQTDAAACPAGNEKPRHYLPLPSFWATRVPNTVLTEQAYNLALDNRLPPNRRILHFSRRHSWWRDIDGGFAERINANVKLWASLGIVAPRGGSAPLPAKIWVETGRSLYDEEKDPTVKQARIAEGLEDPLDS